MSFEVFAPLFYLSDGGLEYGLGGSGVDRRHWPIVY